MFLTSVAILALIGTSMAFENRDGRSGELRVFNFLNVASASGSVLGNARLSNGNDTELFNSATVDVTASVFGGDFTLFNNVQASKEPSLDFTKFDFDTQSTITVQVSLTQSNIRESAAVVCSGVSFAKNKRNTLILTQTVTEESVQSLCSAVDSTCSPRADGGTVGTVSFNCKVHTETLGTHNCDSDNVDIYRVDGAADPQLLSRDDGNLLTNERIVLQTPALEAANVLANLPEDRTFPTDVDYDVVNTQPLFEDGTRGARAHDFFWGGNSAPFFARDQLNTGKVALFNAARRTNEDGTSTLQNVKFVVRSTADIGFGDSNVVVHRSGNVGVGSATSFAELPVGSYTVTIFDGGDSDTEIFGARASAVEATASPILTQSLTVLADTASLVVLEGSANDIAFGNGLLSATAMEFPLRSADVTEDANEIHLVNLVKNSPLTFASPDSECCNFLGAAAIQPGVSNALEFEADASATYDAFLTTTRDCPTLAASLVDENSVSVSGAGAGQCGKEVRFVLGRKRNVEQNVAVCTDCTQDVDIISRLTANDESNNLDVASVTIPIACGCTQVVVETNCTVCDVDEFEAVNTKLDKITSNVSDVLSKVTSSSAAIEDNLESVGDAVDDVEDDIKQLSKDVDKKAFDPIEDIESELDDIKSLAKDTLKAVD